MSCVHLSVHSEYAVVDGMMSVQDLVDQVASYGMPAVALTDVMNMHASVKFYRAALARGVKPLLGSDVWVQHPEHGLGRVLMLCKTYEGYQTLSWLLTEAFRQPVSQHDEVNVAVPWDAVTSTGCRGLLVLAHGVASDVGLALSKGRTQDAADAARAWQHVCGERYYLGLQRVGHPAEATVNPQLCRLAAKLALPLVALHPACFAEPSDFDAHEARVCINQGWTLSDARRPHRHMPEQYVCSAETMARRFQDVPEVLANTLAIAQLCNCQLPLGNVCLPPFPVPDARGIDRYCHDVSLAGLEQRLQDDGVPDTEHARYRERLDEELQVIERMGYSGYFLIVADFIQWAKNQGIPVGPGRGSGAGSLVAYCLGITGIDPLPYDLLFERFLNPERVSMPDFDIDFCMVGRDRVIEYVMQRYGASHVAQIITFGRMAAKAVVRDIGRVLGYPYGFVDQLAKLIPFELGMTLDKAMHDSEELQARYREDGDVATLWDMAKKLEGVTRNVGKHAGGVVIAPEALDRFTPLYRDPSDEEASWVTQLDKDDVESIGLIKFDFLGLRTLTIRAWAVDNVRARYPDRALDIERVPLDDPATYALLKTGQTTAIFQLESQGMQQLIARLQPDCFEDIVALVALFRPGPLQSGMVDDFIDRKHGRAAVTYPHPSVADILKPTYGVILYQEQVMQIAQVLSGYTLGGADLLRRAMGKKKPEEMAKQRTVFVSGAEHQGVDPKTAGELFDLIEKFAGYGFNKSHSVAYAMLSYQTAWLKAHYPAEFMAAVLSADMDNTDKIQGLIQACRSMQLVICPPDVQQSRPQFSVNDDGAIVYGLGAIKGLGQGLADAIVEERTQHGPYLDLHDFCERLHAKRLNRRALETLVRSGAFDTLGPHRAAVFAAIEQALHQASQRAKEARSGQLNLLAMVAANAPQPPRDAVYPDVPRWSRQTLSQCDKEALGFYLTAHPIHAVAQELEALGTTTLDRLHQGLEGNVTLAGLVTAVRRRQTKQGRRMMFLSLDDAQGAVELGVFGELYEHVGETLHEGDVVVVEATCGVDRFTRQWRVQAQSVVPLSQLRALRAQQLQLHLEASTLTPAWLDTLSQRFQALPRGRCKVVCMVRQGDHTVRVVLEGLGAVQLNPEVLAWLDEQPGLTFATMYGTKEVGS